MSRSKLFITTIILILISGMLYAEPVTDLGKRERTESTLIVDCPHIGDTMYTDTGGLVGIDTMRYAPLNNRGKQAIMHGLILTQGTGNIKITLEGGGKATIPFSVDTLESLQALWGVRIVSIDSGSTFTGKIFPLF